MKRFLFINPVHLANPKKIMFKTFMQHPNTHKISFLKQSIAWLLLIVFVYSQLFCFLWNEVKLLQIRHEVKFNILSQLADNQLVAFQKDLDFDEDEFESNGKMYDVVRVEFKQNHQIVYCFLDSEETTLAIEIDKKINENLDKSPLKKDSQSQVLKLIKSIFEDFKSLDFAFKTSFLSIQNHYNYLLKIPQNYSSLIQNPPEI
jgi:hypothetical protein